MSAQKPSVCAVMLFLVLGCVNVGWAQSEPAPAAGTPSTAVPRLVKFSGTVKDAAGNPRTGVVGMTFALYQGQEGGVALWLETQNVTLDAQGRYSVLLGAASVEGMPAEVFSSNQARWLGIQPEGQAEQRVLLVSVPYALKAADAETLGGMPASSFVLAAPMAAGTTGSTGQTTSTAAASATAPSPAQISGSGTLNTIPKFDSTGTDPNLVNSSITDSGTAVSTMESVGIGTATPNAALDVEFTTAAATNAMLSNINYNNTTAVSGAVVSAFDMNFMDASTATNLSKQTARIALIRQPGATGTVTAFDSALTATEFLHASAPYPIRGINIEGPTMDSGTALSFFTGLYIGSPSGAGTVTNKYAMVTEPNAGNVGIGTTSPGMQLEVAGNVMVDGTINGSGAGLTNLPANQLSGTVTQAALNGVNGSGLTNLTAANLTGTVPSSALSGVNGSGLTNLNAANLTGTLPSATLTGVNGSGLANVNAAMLGGFLPGAFATTGANTFTGSQTINSGGTALTADGTGAAAIGLQASSNDVNGIGAVITNSAAAGEILSVRDNTGFEVLHADAQGLILTARTDQYRFTNDATTGTVLNELVTLTPQGNVIVTSAGATGGAHGIVTAGAGTSGSAVVAIWGGVGCVFDNTAVDGDYVQISPTAAGQCHDAGPTYPTSGQVVGFVQIATSTPPTIRLFQTEVRGAGGGGTITAVNTAAGSGLMGGVASGAANLSLINSCGSGQVLQWNGTAWACATVSSGAGVTSVMAGTGLIGSPSNPIISTGTLSIATGGVSNAMLANPSLTVTAGTDLTGGGSVALGGSTTLNLDTTKVPQLNSANIFTGNQTVNGSLTLTGAAAINGIQLNGGGSGTTATSEISGNPSTTSGSGGLFLAASNAANVGNNTGLLFIGPTSGQWEQGPSSTGGPTNFESIALNNTTTAAINISFNTPVGVPVQTGRYGGPFTNTLDDGNNNMTVLGWMWQKGRNYLHSNPSNPTSTSNTNFTMMGLGSALTLTPNFSGTVIIRIDSEAKNTVDGNGILFEILYGTGTAPSNGSLTTGTQVGPTFERDFWGQNATVGFGTNLRITGLTVGTAYWFDIALKSLGSGSSNATIQNIEFYIEEI